MSHYIHSLPGRLRVQARQLRHAACAVEKLCAAFAQLDGIKSHQFNHKAGSVLVQYDADKVSAEDILYQLYKAGCLPPKPALRAGAHSHPTGQFGTVLGNALFGTLVKKGLETSVASFARAFI